jgi:hypothetical protein
VAPFDEDDDTLWSDDDEFEPDRPGPEIDIPETPDLSDIDASNDVAQTFWIVVIMVDIGLLAISLGIMFIVFRSELRLGGGLFAIGAFALLSGYRHYRNYKND